MAFSFLRRLRITGCRYPANFTVFIVGVWQCRKQWLQQYRYYCNWKPAKHTNFAFNHSFQTKWKPPPFVTKLAGRLWAGIIASTVTPYIKNKKMEDANPFLYRNVMMKDLSGRRKEYSFVAEVAKTICPAVVYVELQDVANFDYYSGLPSAVSSGSGFLIASDGLILTNSHVVMDEELKVNKRILVTLTDGRSFEGEVEYADKIYDIAMVRIQARNLPIADLGTSQDLKSGEWVVAVGSPMGYSNSVTCGIISSYRKSVEIGLHDRQIEYIQTDTPINSGNSGGPLCNLEGQVVGINSMKILPGISFAIPIDYVKDFLKPFQHRKFIQKMKKCPSYLGINVMNLTACVISELRKRECGLSEKVKFGVYIWRVKRFSPAE